jgi:hypothetical protein
MRHLMLVAIFSLVFAASGQAAPFPGPTGLSQSGEFVVVSEKLAEISEEIPLDSVVMSAEEAPSVFPATYIKGDKVLAWRIDSETGDLEEVYELPAGLSDTMKDAVLKAPTWIQTPLIDRFLHLDAEEAEDFADLILNPADERYVDELAYLIAMMGERDMTDNSILDLIEENVALIYEYDAELAYVEVIDEGSPSEGGDYYTTVEYVNLVDGIPTTFTLPREIYYDYIVHPKLDMETVNYIQPSTGYKRSPSQGGVFWRDYYWNDAPGMDSYTIPWFMQHPTAITEAELQDWGNTADNTFTSRDIYNLDLVLHTNGDPVMVEFAYGAGEAIFTTMNVEEAYFAAESDLLKNMLMYGCGDMALPLDAKVVFVDGISKIDTIGALIVDMESWGFTDVNRVGLSVFETYTDVELAEIAKIVVVSDSTHDLYALFAKESKSVIESWLSGGYRVLELHLATSVDISDITFIGGHTVGATNSASTDEVVLNGRPLMSEVIKAADHIWDGIVYGGVGGDRSFDSDGTMALMLAGNFLGKNMMDNISEVAAKTGSWSVERAIQPVRLLYNHFGNCGECQDGWCATLRTLLIPCLNVSDINEDHVWNEFYHDGEWFYLQNDWSNAATRIGTPGGGQDSDYGGGKTTSFIFGWQGNGEIFSVIDRYSEFVTLKVELTDPAGRPVPGASIQVASEGWQSSSIRHGYNMFTDENGLAEATFGDGRNYNIRIDSGAGSWPDNVNTHWNKVIEDVDATPGRVFTFTHEMPEKLEGDIEIAETMPATDVEEEGRYGAHLSFTTNDRFQHLTHVFNGVTFTRMIENLGVDVMLVSEDNYKNARLGRDEYHAVKVWQNVTEFDETVIVPDVGEDFFLLVSNFVNPESTITLDLDIEAAENPDDDDDVDDDDSGDDDDDDSGCGC